MSFLLDHSFLLLSGLLMLTSGTSAIGFSMTSIATVIGLALLHSGMLLRRLSRRNLRFLFVLPLCMPHPLLILHFLGAHIISTALLCICIFGHQSHTTAMSSSNHCGSGVHCTPSQLKFLKGTSAIPDGYKYISLSQLEASCPSSNLLKSVFLGRIVYYKRGYINSKEKVSSQRTTKTGKTPGLTKRVVYQNWDSILVISCLNTDVAGMSSAVITLNPRKFDMMFGISISGRESVINFGPGSVVAIVSPHPIDSYFGFCNGLPVLNFNGGMKVVDMEKTDVSLVQRSISLKVNRLQAFHYPEVQVELISCCLAQSTCCGYLCDSVGLKTYDGWRRRCPCYHMMKSLGHVVLDLNLRLHLLKDGVRSGVTFACSNFTSRRFTQIVLGSKIPVCINTQQIDRDGVDFKVVDQVERVIECINSKGGFKAFGWAKLGYVPDFGTLHDRDAAVSKLHMLVSASDLRLHLVNLDVNCSRIEVESMHTNICDLIESDTIE